MLTPIRTVQRTIERVREVTDELVEVRIRKGEVWGIWISRDDRGRQRREEVRCTPTVEQAFLSGTGFQQRMAAVADDTHTQLRGA